MIIMSTLKRFTLIGFLTIIILSAPNSLFAQFSEPVDPCTDPADPCPIDSNLIVLFAAAVVVAAKKTYDFKRNAILK